MGEVHFRNNNENLYESMELFTIVLWRILHSLMEEYTVCSSLDHYGIEGIEYYYFVQQYIISHGQR
jgi:hypothetical protein